MIMSNAAALNSTEDRGIAHGTTEDIMTANSYVALSVPCQIMHGEGVLCAQLRQKPSAWVFKHELRPRGDVQCLAVTSSVGMTRYAVGQGVFPACVDVVGRLNGMLMDLRKSSKRAEYARSQFKFMSRSLLPCDAVGCNQSTFKS